ncbi:MAG: calcium-binding protein, partial [Paracoccaceae bacterium]
MALQIISTNTVVASGPAVNLTDTDSVFVATNVVVAVQSGVAINGTGSGHRATIAGNVMGGFIGIALGSDGASDVAGQLVVTSSGVVSASGIGAVLRTTSGSGVNYGSISGGTYGYILSGTGLLTTSTLQNYGSIFGGNYGVARDGAIITERFVVTNLGTITSPIDAFNSLGAIAIDVIYNRGMMVGQVRLDGGTDLFDNRNGTVIGDVFMGDGVDVYDGRGGSVQGVISGDAGVDTFRVGADIETIDGGADNDLLDFRTTSGIQVALDLAFANTGVAAGDEYTNLENIYGSSFGNDLLRGNALNNGFFGFGGNDTLQGGAGVDQLAGGNGADAMNGGAGNDTFLYLGLGEAGDVIVDFTNVGGNDDR